MFSPRFFTKNKPVAIIMYTYNDIAVVVTVMVCLVIIGLLFLKAYIVHSSIIGACEPTASRVGHVISAMELVSNNKSQKIKKSCAER